MPGCTLSLTTEYGTVTISVNRDDMTLDELIEHLITPVLLGAGYNSELVKERLDSP